MSNRVAIWRRHVSGFVEVGVYLTSTAVRFYVVPQSARTKRLRGKKEISEDEHNHIKNEAEKTNTFFSGDKCGCPECHQQKFGVDRGVPLCDEHWEKQEWIADRDVSKYWRGYPDEKFDQDLDRILFGD